MNLGKLYAVDKEAALDGKWFVTRAGMKVKVAKAGNQNFINSVTKLQKPVLQLLASSMDTTDLLTDITCQSMSEAILLDWENEGEDGILIPYTPELGKQALLEYEDFREDVSILSDQRNNFKPEEAAKK